jgi:formate C-acetyltransferase
MCLNDAINEVRESVSLRKMTERTQRHYKRILESMNQKQALWGGNLTILNDKSRKMSPAARRSLAFEKVMYEMPIHIEPYALLAGLCQKDGQIVRCVLPSFIIEEERGKAAMGISHKCPDYETLLSIGFSGILAKMDENKQKLEQSGMFDESKKDFYETVRRECLAVIALSHRYANLAEQMGMTELARICRRVPEFGAQSFHEAVQSLWFYNHCIHETMIRLSIGNIDRLLNPYFEKDFRAGKISLEHAQEIVDEFNLRVNDRIQINPENYVISQKELEGAPTDYGLWYGQGFVTSAENDGADAINHFGQNILLSGLREENGNLVDSTSVLTYMFLNAHEKFMLAAPVLTMRLHKNSPAELVERTAEVLKTGGGMPFINNDDVIIPGYVKLGVSLHDAAEYANSNCWETLIQGRSNQEMIRFINFLHLLELTLNNGEPILPRERARGIQTGDVSGFSSMEDILDAWKKQIDYRLKTTMAHTAADISQNGSHGQFTFIPVLSALTRDCIETMTDLTHGGTRYTLWHMLAEAVSNAADALSAIQKFVFDEKLVTLPRLVEIMRANWEGDDEAKELRLRFLSGTPRFGNDLQTPDSFAEKLVSYFTERVEYHAQKYSDICIYSPCIATFSWIISIGKRIAASADGRKHGEPIAANMSPAMGADTSGSVCAINSYLKLNPYTNKMPAGAPIDLRINKRGLENAEGTKRISALIKTFIEQRGNMITLTITDAEELRRAIADPEKYRSLRVRMGGWSAYFVLLSKESQKIHLHRSEHGF